MILLTAAEMRRIDRDAAEQYGVSTLRLMEGAGEKTARLAVRFMDDLGLSGAVVICGKGNNGGDGLAAALRLCQMGRQARAVLLCSPHDLSGDPAAVLVKIKSAGVKVEQIDCRNLGPVLASADSPHLLIDALFGTGFRPPPAFPWDLAIEAINRSGLPVLSVDLPSGIDADRCDVEGPAVRATWTLTLGAPKAALFVYPAAGFAGTVLVADIGHPRELFQRVDQRQILLEAGWCREMLAPRRAESHKGTFGHLLVVAGSATMPGAALLSSLGALRSGVGLVSLASPGQISHWMVPSIPEALHAPLPMDVSGVLSESSFDVLSERLPGKDALVIGPGLGHGAGVTATVRSLLTECPLPLLLDADGLNALSGDLAWVRSRTHFTVLTPHPGELARLTATTAERVQADRVGAARSLAESAACVVVLKGAGSLVAEPGGRLMVNASGNPGMASGGMGDVLSGLIGGFLAQGLPPIQAAAMGVYLHGLAGDLAASRSGPWGFTPREVADLIPEGVQAVLDGHEDVESV